MGDESAVGESGNTKFLGLGRFQFLWMVILLLLASWSMSGYETYKLLSLTSEVHGIQTYQCRQLDIVKHNIVTQYRRSLVTLPTLAYYKRHPDELNKQLNLIHKQITFYQAPACPLPN